ncbi:PA domain-containing protein [Colletotrichum orchidophilum]|uniref:PA domain-containing protein n=1 Tax=Colletotrichum orchidophilum TaxID=1209926 RepID=A0A1G4AQG5_9PEZI|nr:PA domain-containing protein [Colletotrichum orchidophilum]OHE91417.1 PA domain-containing protein [Colletotrichum orchidophilum]
MAKTCLTLLLGFLLAWAANGTKLRKTYIVQLKDTQASGAQRGDQFDASLASVSASPADTLYHYQNVTNGYAAKITDDQANALRNQDDVLSVTLDQVYVLHTTRTPAFLGLDDASLLGRGLDLDPSSYLDERGDSGIHPESNLIVGVVDTGVRPENPSFKDDGMPPIPAHWKGKCEATDDFPATSCNKKLIGARAFYKGYEAALSDDNGLFNWTGESKSPRDDDGHGSHTSSTAAGAAVPNASLFGQASGTARGMAVHARLAMYKACWSKGCVLSDVLAGMDKAISDGVNVMSLSLGSNSTASIDPISVGSFAAVQKGIFVAQSAGNEGPAAASVVSIDPWTLTVAASTLDRDFPAQIILGNDKNYTGTSLYSNGSVTDIKPLTAGEVLPLIQASQAGSGNVTSANLCLEGSLDPAKVVGKVVICVRGENARVDKGGVVKTAGGRGMILVNAPVNGNELIADAHILPALHLTAADGDAVSAYAKTGKGTVILDFEGTRLGIPAPVMASFSSRGPNSVLPQILKPDITGPGVSILAAWSDQGPTGLDIDTRKVDQNVISGTSMSCPHLSGIAIWIMARRPGWSPAAIRSAIMTTAYTTTKGTKSPLLDSRDDTPATPFVYGSGHVDPVAALNPGLVYDIAPADYLDSLCAINPNPRFLHKFVKHNFTCASNQTYSLYNLNYPSFSAAYGIGADPASDGSFTATFKRTLTNVGGAGTYKAQISLNDAGLVQVSVKPETLTFETAGEKKTFELTVKMSPPPPNPLSWGRLVWSDGTHVVGSTLSFVWGIPNSDGT